MTLDVCVQQSLQIKSGLAALEHHSIPGSCWQRAPRSLDSERSEYEANVLEGTRTERADGCGRMVRRLYCVNADAHELNSESESN